MQKNKSETYYSPTYETARQRFCDTASQAKAILEQYSVDVPGFDRGALTIDVAKIGSPNPDWAVVVSSGVHGVEGFCGSAIQLAWLSRVNAGQFVGQNALVILIHGLNPYGFKMLRRTNEDNIDLNRNFLRADSDYKGAPVGYEALNQFLNPPSPPSRFELFWLKAIAKIRRLGLPAMKEAIAGGQYQFPQGLFFGGYGPSQSARIIQANFEKWLSGAREIVHIDFHSGLGKYSEYKLLLTESADSPQLSWYGEKFGELFIEPLANAEGTAYQASGVLGDFLLKKLEGRNYRFLGAEFGTYSIIRVLGALRAENRAHFYGQPTDPAYKQAKSELLECFCPKSQLWRSAVIERGVRIIQQGIQSKVARR